MRYDVQFAAGKVGAASAAPFQVEVPDSLYGAARNSDLARRIRERAVAALTASPALGAVTANASEIERRTQVVVDTGTGEGTVYFGTTTLATVLVHAVG